jgi:hypothetical protein
MVAYSDAGVRERERETEGEREREREGEGKKMVYSVATALEYASSLSLSLSSNPSCPYCSLSHSLAYTGEVYWIRGYLRQLGE